MRRVLACVLPIVLAAIAALLASPTSATAAVQPNLSSVRLTAVSSAPLFSSGPTAVEYDRTNLNDAGGYARTDEILIDLGGGTSHIPFGLDLRAPVGVPFHVGDYAGNDTYGGAAGDGSLDYQNNSCANVAFTIIDLAVSGRTITRLDLRFHADCLTSISGELQLGEPAVAAGVVSGIRSFGWPVTPVNTISAQVLPVWLRNTATSSVQLGVIGVGGSNPTDFTVLADHCSRIKLAPNAGCQLSIAFSPHAAGLRAGQLSVPVGSSVGQIALNGTGPLGRSLLSISSRPGDFVGQGRSVLITDAQSMMQVARHDRTWFVAGLNDGPYSWSVDVRTPDGAPLATGTHVTNDDNDHSGYTLMVSGDGRGCGAETGSVTINQVAFAADGTPTLFDATFRQTCTDSPAGLTGEIAYRATNTPTPPSAPFVLRTGTSLGVGKTIKNADGAQHSYQLGVGTDGRAVLRTAGGAVLWSTPTSGTGTANRLQVGADGSLAVITASGKVVWQVRPTGARAGDFLELQDDGNLVLYGPDSVPLWSTGTSQPQS